MCEPTPLPVPHYGPQHIDILNQYSVNCLIAFTCPCRVIIARENLIRDFLWLKSKYPNETRGDLLRSLGIKRPCCIRSLVTSLFIKHPE